eukprot:2084967-Pyramimonas_sp.AAC.1
MASADLANGCASLGGGGGTTAFAAAPGGGGGGAASAAAGSGGEWGTPSACDAGCPKLGNNSVAYVNMRRRMAWPPAPERGHQSMFCLWPCLHSLY